MGERIIPLEHLGRVFQRHFEVVRADTPLLLDDALRLRYQVYCRENNYEHPGSFADGREFDNFDLFSVHSYVKHLESSLTAANVRLILPRKGDRQFHFPIQDYVDNELIQAHCEWKSGDINETAEISRFCVSREFKHRRGEEQTISGAVEQFEFPLGAPEELHLIKYMSRVERNSYHSANGRLLPHITLGLFAAIFEMSAEEGIKHWFALMEPSLLKLLKRFGIEFSCIGDPIEHRGLRQPCYALIDDVALGIWEKRPDIWRFITKNGEVWPLPETETSKIFSAL